MSKCVCAFVFVFGLLAGSSFAQTPFASDSSVPTLRVGTSLTLVDVLADAEVKGLHTRQLLTDLRKEDVGKAITSVNALLVDKTHAGETRLGELALQVMVGKILAAEDEENRKHLPILLFFYGDRSATYPDEAEKVLVDLLQHSGIVFGVNLELSNTYLNKNLGAPGQISRLVHSYTAETGGQYYSSEHVEQFPNAVAYILAQTHLRYVLGFKPPALDGKRHRLRVELTADARRRYGKRNSDTVRSTSLRQTRV